MTDDPWQFYDDIAAGKPVIANPDNPQLGFYRRVRRDGYLGSKVYDPVAYYLDENGAMQCWLGPEEGGESLDMSEGGRGRGLWHHVWENWITQEQYFDVARDGKPWHDEHPLVGMQGHNKPPKELSLEDLAAEIDNLGGEAKRRLKGPPISTQDECDQLANLVDRLAELYKACEEQEGQEEQPLKAALKDVKERWGRLTKAAEVFRQIKTQLITPWLQYQERAIADAAVRAASAGEVLDLDRAGAGTRGRKITLREYKVAKIVDYRAALEYFADGNAMHQFVATLVDRAVRQGTNVPGVEVTIESKAV